jgi:RimJ/RimL family protein N-acetyltransferase
VIHVELRPVRQDDLPILFEHQADPVAAAVASFPSRDREAFDAHWARLLHQADNVVRTIELNGRTVGNIGSWEQEGERLVGYWVGRDDWGKGVATAALAAFIDVERTRPLHAHVAVDNAGSIRVLEKCGFERVSASTGDDGVEELLFRLA